jgi:hypothetical protein
VTEAQIIARARDLIGVSGALELREVSEQEIRAAAGIRPAAAYRGSDAYGTHRIVVRRGLAGIARIYAVCHEAVHALQEETLGGHAAFRRAYFAEDDLARMHGATERDAYRQNRFERAAKDRGAEVAAKIAAEIEEEHASA